MLTQKDIELFKNYFKQTFGTEIKSSDAEKLITRMVSFYSVVYGFGEQPKIIKY